LNIPSLNLDKFSEKVEKISKAKLPTEAGGGFKKNWKVKKNM